MSARPRSARRPKARPANDCLRVRMYNVLFGDAILVSLFEGGEARHILIDVGNVTGVGGDTDVFRPVIDDVLAELNGSPLDLYVMTHEHMDHVKGLLYANDKLNLQLVRRGVRPAALRHVFGPVDEADGRFGRRRAGDAHPARARALPVLGKGEFLFRCRLKGEATAEVLVVLVVVDRLFRSGT